MTEPRPMPVNFRFHTCPILVVSWPLIRLIRSYYILMAIFALDTALEMGRYLHISCTKIVLFYHVSTFMTYLPTLCKRYNNFRSNPWLAISSQNLKPKLAKWWGFLLPVNQNFKIFGPNHPLFQYMAISGENLKSLRLP